MRHHDPDGEQALAITVGLLLLVGTALIVSCWAGPVTAFALTAVPVLGAYLLPRFAHFLAVRRAVRRLLPVRGPGGK